MQEKAQSSQIKDELQLIELNESVEFIQENLPSIKQKERQTKIYKRFPDGSFRHVE